MSFICKKNLTVNFQEEKTMVKNMDTQEEIRKTMDELRDFLIQKNEQYGDSVMNPIRIFSKADTDAGLRIRIDDKLNRLMQGNDSMESDEDVVKDLIGYLALLLLALRNESEEIHVPTRRGPSYEKGNDKSQN